MTRPNLILLTAVLAGQGAWAQNYVIQSQSMPYSQVTGGMSVMSQFADFDEDAIAVPIGFAFPYYGSTYTTVYVSTNGFLSFDPTTPSVCQGFSLCLEGSAIPSPTRTPHAVISPWWDDHMLTSGVSDVIVKSSASEFEVEYRNLTPWSSGSDWELNFKVKLTAAGTIYIHYGSPGAAPTFGSASVGFENATGTPIGMAGASLPVPPNNMPCSSTTSACSPTANWPLNTLYVIGQPVQPDLAVQTVNLNSVTRMGASLTLNIAPLFRNYGQNPASGFLWKAYLSTDRVLDASDITVLTSTTPLNCAGGMTVTDSAMATIAAPPSGNYFVLVEVDPAPGVVVEALESNNVGSTANYFVSGMDLVATSVSGPAMSGPGNNMTVNVQYFNQGTDPAGTVSYEIRLSADNMYQASDYVLYTAMNTVAGGQTINDMVTFPVGMNVPGGDFFYILRVLPVTGETSMTNNVAVSTGKVTVRQADLEVQAVDFVDPATGSSIRRGLFGTQARMTVTARNTGGADARNFRVGIVVSADTNLSLLSDTLVIESLTPLVASGTSQIIDVPFTLPVTDRSGLPFPTGNYFVFALLDSRAEVTELNEQNNNTVMMQPVLLSAPAADLTVVRFDAPPSVGVGEIAPVYRVLKNIGNVDAPEVKYRYYVSANAQITVDDTLLPIVSGMTMMGFNSVTLPIGAVDAKTEFVQLPAGLTPGTYYLGCVVDSEGQVVELDESNNGLGSTAVQVAASSLKVVTTAVPDAVLGRPYSFGCAVSGDVPGTPTTWAIDLAQGPLADGLTLSPAGLVTGTPTREQVVGFTVVATNNGRTAMGRLAMRVLPTTTQVEITTPSLPSIVNSPTLPYEVWLGAAGGLKPYAWRVVAGTLPRNLTLTSEGKLSGFPQAGMQPGTTQITIEVKDQLGTRSTRQFNLRLVEPGSIIFTNLVIPDGLVGVNYTTDISVKNADNSPLAKPLLWNLASGALPPGLTMSKEQDVVLITGTPVVAGTYAFTLEVEDAKGRNDTADFLLRVYPARLKVSVNGMPELMRPGDPVDFNFVVGGNPNTTFQLFSGALPPGVTLQTDGKVNGMVKPEESEGTYNFVVEAKDATGANGLGVFTIEVKRDTRQRGCSAAPTGAALWLLVAFLPLLAFRRRVKGLAVVALLAVPFAASAQTYDVLPPIGITYSSLSNGTSVAAGQVVTIPFAFKFYGQPLTTVEFSQYGYLTPGGGDDTELSNPGIPHNVTTAPTTVIAPWWDSICAITTCTGGLFRFQVFGAPPNRYIAFEWYNLASSQATTGQRMSFQAILYETSNQIRFAYGPTAPGAASATVGIQKQASVGIAGLACTSPSSGNCSGTNWPAGQAIDFRVPADLTISSLSMDQIGYAGVAFHATALVANLGGNTCPSNPTVKFYLSQDPILNPSDPVIGETVQIAFPPGGMTVATLVGTIPAGTMPGPYYVLTWADYSDTNPPPDPGTCTESLETNNLGQPTAILVGMPTPDLVVSGITYGMTSTPGAMVAAGRTISNVGNADAPASAYQWFISDNSVVSISDMPLGPARTAPGLPPMQMDIATDMLLIPATLPAGEYWIGACANYDPAAAMPFALAEISQVNNCTQKMQSIIISSGQLSIITSAMLPPANQYAPYGLRLKAVGGNGPPYTWAVSAGSTLPAGLTLNPVGDLQGTPAVAGTFTFEVEVTSGMNAKTALTLMVAPGSIPLAIVDQDLPAAEFGRAYGADLVAVGGKPPYVWALKSDGRLPNGLRMSNEGHLEGRAAESGEFSFGVTLTDTDMVTASKDLKVRVVNPTTMHIATSKLGNAMLKQEYTQQLVAVGGKTPYTWTLLKFQQLPQNATEEPGPALTEFPMNFGIHLEDGNSDYLRGEPKAAGQYALTFRVTDANSAEDYTTLLLTISYTEPIAITTTALPDGFVGNDYSVRLSHNRGKESTGIRFIVPCVKQATSTDQFVCAPMDETQNLPPGLLLGQDGAITGIPADTLNGADDKVYSFLVKVVDEAGRQDVRSLSIRLRPSIRSTGGGGCSGTGLAGLAPAALALVALALIRRKKALVP